MSSSVAHWAVGIDVAIKSAHKVSILDRRTGQPVRRTLSVARTFEGVQRLKEILSEADRVEVAIEPAGNAWRPLAGALMAYGFDVYLVDPKKSSRLRKALSDHVKSDRVDAEALARLLLMLKLPRAGGHFHTEVKEVSGCHGYEGRIRPSFDSGW